ncbi:MAG TPA: hypothetical protein ACQGQF_02050, partial [Xylella fastidiosa subsp. pauca]
VHHDCAREMGVAPAGETVRRGLRGGAIDYGLREIATGLYVMVTQGLVLLKEFAAVVRQSVRKSPPVDQF